MVPIKQRKKLTRGCVSGLFSLFTLTSLLQGQTPTPDLTFNQEIRPILTDLCIQCHGPDSVQRKASLRLDTEAGLFSDRGDYRIVVPGNLEESELFQRLISPDEDQRMPPESSGLKIRPEQIDLIRKWIEQGAPWQQHWSFIPPKRAVFPRVSNTNWIRNGIDYFVLKRLETAGLHPANEAARETLIRRVSLDLTGLPPSPEEIDTFLLDNTPDAFEKVVDRLLASPRYGERMAERWMDLARYADTSGYQNDGPRYMWRWRDWVISAYNRNLSFRDFTIEQLAGDMLDNPTLDQLIATGFNRNHRGNAEGGIIPEEFAVEYVVDRVETTGTVWLGLTIGCGRCHDHKFDPLSQKDFYQLFAYFNNIPENGRAIKEGNSPPFIKAPTTDQQQILKQLESKRNRAERHFSDLRSQLSHSILQWQTDEIPTAIPDGSIADQLTAHYALDGNLDESKSRTPPGAFQDGDSPFVPGRIKQGLPFNGKHYLDLGDIANFSYFDSFSFSMWVFTEPNQGGTLISRMKDEHRGSGYSVVVENQKIQVNLIQRWLDDAIRVETVEALNPQRWSHIAVTYDGSRTAQGISVYVNGKSQELIFHLDGLNQSFAVDEPFRIGGGGGPEGRFHGRVDDVRIYDKSLTSDEITILSTAESLHEILAIDPGERSDPQIAKLEHLYLMQFAPESLTASYLTLLKTRKEYRQFYRSIPTVMVMKEQPGIRDTFILDRGQYDKPESKVTAKIPAVFHPLPKGLPANRLGLASWLVAAENPLTARVAVNRYWNMYFGNGLVATLEDFGSQGSPPTHPHLLDWLATEFIHSNWNVKELQKLIVMSATYRQSSYTNNALRSRDPENLLLARGPRHRMAAAMIRDQALAISGLLVERLGGPSVKPYQPEGLWKEIATDTDYEQDRGDNLYRRSLYTYWKRTVNNPTMTNFDASPRETCTVIQQRTNTPLQALTLMNDITFVEASRMLGERMMKEVSGTPAARLAYGFRLATSRFPEPAEHTLLINSLNTFLNHFLENSEAAEQLINHGDHPRDETLDKATLAAYASVAGLLLNLDEVITKE